MKDDPKLLVRQCPSCSTLVQTNEDAGELCDKCLRRERVSHAPPAISGGSSVPKVGA